MPKEVIKVSYSKALRCTFFWERKNSCSSKLVQLLLFNRAKARWSKKRAAQGFHYINSFSSNYFGPNSKTCTCKDRVAWGLVSRGLTVIPFWDLYIIFLWNFPRPDVRQKGLESGEDWELFAPSISIFLDPIQKRAPARSVLLKAVYLEALL